MRPGYIPRTTIIGGRSCDIIFSPIYHGYGYFNPFGAWMMYAPPMPIVTPFYSGAAFLISVALGLLIVAILIWFCR